jgi:hypothetical protein
MSTKTTIILEKETRQLLQKVGRKEQTYDMLIRELVARAKECEKCGEVIKEDLSGSGLVPAARQIIKSHDESSSEGVHK